MTENNSANEWELQGPDDNGANVPGADSTNAQDDLGVGASDINEAPKTQVYDMRDLGSESDSDAQPWEVFDENPGDNPGVYPGGYPGNGPAPSDTAAWGAPMGSNGRSEKKSKGWLWAIAGALVTIAVIAAAGLLYILKIDKEVNGSNTAAAKSTSTVTETAGSSASTSTTTKASKSKSASATGGCSPSDFPSSSGNLVVVECTGQWALVGPPQTDGLSTMHWENGQWIRVEEDGKRTFGMSGPCFTSGYMRQLGMPSSFAERVGCGDEPAESSTSTATSTQPADDSSGFISSVSTSRGPVSASHPACDGRTILIVQSVLDGNNSTTRNELAGALEQDGDLEFAPPGQCPSLRGSYNGSDVYPVYFDMGANQAAACSAKRQWGGNVRTLNNEGDFSDPC